METPSNIIFLYSKYSPNCKRLMDTIKSSNLDFFVNLCIDNQIAREKVLKSSFKIESVPCLIVTYPSGGVEKFEGSSASHWTENLLGQLRPVPKPLENTRYASPPRKQNNDEESEHVKPIRRQSKSNQLSTSIDELIDLDEDDEDDEDVPHRPRKDPLNGLAPRIANPRSKNAETMEDPEMDPNLIDEKVKKAVKGENGNIMAQAQAMQKQRDRENEKVRLPVGN
jgi:hypothetical protein